MKTWSKPVITNLITEFNDDPCYGDPGDPGCYTPPPCNCYQDGGGGDNICNLV